MDALGKCIMESVVEVNGLKIFVHSDCGGEKQ